MTSDDLSALFMGMAAMSWGFFCGYKMGFTQGQRDTGKGT